MDVDVEVEVIIETKDVVAVYVLAAVKLVSVTNTLTTTFVKTPKTLCARAQNRVRGFPTTKVLGGVVGPKIFVRTPTAVFQTDVT